MAPAADELASSTSLMKETNISPDYGYDGSISEIRRLNYQHLDHTYLDHAAATVYPSSLIKASSAALLNGGVFGNPHSHSPASEATDRLIEETRSSVLRMFNADPAVYSVVFVANTTAAAKLVGEGLGAPETRYVYLKDSHTSLVGLRELCPDWRTFTPSTLDGVVVESSRSIYSWPCQSNFSGKKYPSLEWITKIRSRDPRGLVLLDAAALCSSSPLDLSTVDADFVMLSFYKMFGYPDLGALIVKTRVAEDFFSQRRYFGGGTLDSLAVDMPFAPRKRYGGISSVLEDGTLPFHSIISLKCAMQVYQDIYGSFACISKHTYALTRYLYDRLSLLQYHNGTKLCHIYVETTKASFPDISSQGPILTFNLKDSSGRWIGYSDVELVASASNISLRTGTLCNSGAACEWLGLSDEDVIENYSNGHVCGDTNDVINGVPTGAVRTSIGACSAVEDVDRLVSCFQKYFIDPYDAVHPLNGDGSVDIARVASITIYPIKSCSGFTVPKDQSWAVYDGGLEWDREFCLINQSTQTVLSLKKYPKMVFIKPRIYDGKLTVDIGSRQLSIALDRLRPQTEQGVRVCGSDVVTQVYTEPEIVSFFSEGLGISCTLARIANQEFRMFKLGPSDLPPTMVNSSPVLLISRTSVSHLSTQAQCPVDESIFRGNLIISTNEEYLEDSWKSIEIGSGKSSAKLRMLGPCRRCRMVSVDAVTGQINPAPLQALQQYRRSNGKLLFGQHMMLDPTSQNNRIRVGDIIYGHRK